MAGQDLGTSDAPMHVLATVARIPILGSLIDVGVLVSLFAGTLACITAAARVLLLMAHNGLAHGSLRATHVRHETPQRAIVITGIAAVLPVAILAARGDSGLDVYGWMGSLATYGFIVTYGLVCFALPRYLRDHGVVHPARRSFPGWRSRRCCSRWSATCIRFPKAPTASCPTSISRTSLPACSGSLSRPAPRTPTTPELKESKWERGGSQFRERQSPDWRVGGVSHENTIFSSLLRLRFRVRLREQQQHDPNHRKHSKRRVLSVPAFRLPHQKPFAAHAQKRHQPHQQTQRQPGDRHSFRRMKFRGRSAKACASRTPPHQHRIIVSVSHAMIER